MNEFKILACELRREILLALREPKSKSELYKMFRPKAFYTIVRYHLRVLLSHGYIEETDGVFSLTEKGKQLLEKWLE